MLVKILLLTQWFDPEPTFKGLLFAKTLRDKGYDVEVLTGFPNYPGGKIYKGYKISLYQKEIIDGITIHRVPLYPSHDGSALKRIFNYVSFLLSSILIGLIKTRNIDVIYSYHPPLTTALSAVVLGFFKRIPFVVDIQDLWPDTLMATGMINNKKILNVINFFCKFVYKSASEIVVLSPGFKQRLIERNVPSEKITVIYNWCDEKSISEYQPCSFNLPNNKLNLVFAGNLGFAQGLDAIIDAAKILNKKQIPVNIIFIGDGVSKESAIENVKKSQIDNVFFIPRVPMTQVGDLLHKADMLLVHLNEDDLFKITIPSRTQAYLATGKPIVMGVSGDASNLILESDAGVICEPNNANSLSDAIIKLASMSVSQRIDMGERGKSFYYDKLSVDKGVDRFISIFKKACKNEKNL